MPEESEENTPTNTWRGNVKEEWCDYNGHLNLAYYVVIFDLATDAFYDAVGLGETYKNITNHSWFTAESHVCYVSEVFAGTEIYCTTQLIGFDKNALIAASQSIILVCSVPILKCSNCSILCVIPMNDSLNKRDDILSAIIMRTINQIVFLKIN